MSISTYGIPLFSIFSLWLILYWLGIHKLEDWFGYNSKRKRISRWKAVYFFIVVYLIESMIIYKFNIGGWFIYCHYISYISFCIAIILWGNRRRNYIILSFIKLIYLLDLTIKFVCFTQVKHRYFYMTMMSTFILKISIALYFIMKQIKRYYNKLNEESTKIKSIERMINQFIKGMKFIFPHYISLSTPKDVRNLTGAIAIILIERVANFYTSIYLRRSVEVIEIIMVKDDLKSTFWSDYCYTFIPYFLLLLINEIDYISDLKNRCFDHLRSNIQVSISTLVFNRIICLPYEYYLNNNCGRIMESIEGSISYIESTLNNLIFNSLPDILDYGISLGIYYNVFGFKSLCILSCFTLVDLMVEYFYIEEDDYSNNDYEESETDNVINDNILAFDIVKMFTGEKHESNRYRKELNKMQEARNKWHNNTSMKNNITTIVKNVAFTICGSLCIYDAYAGIRSGSDFIYFISFYRRVYYGIYSFKYLYESIKSVADECNELLDILDRPITIDLKKQLNNIEPLKSIAIEFKDVCFNYPDKPILLNKISFKISKGKTVAIVGNSGNGKSTLVKLLNNFYYPTEGNIYVNQQNIKNMDEHTLRSYFGVVPQSIILFNESIKYNIKYGKPNATDEEVIKAAKMAHIHDMISNLPDGYDTKIGGSGLTLSGGEKQRLSLARVFLKDSPIIILDEATSSLDNITEKLIQKTIKNFSQEKKTMIIIAHRLTTITHADLIICLKNGKVHEQGTHEELLNKKGEYFKLWN